jgi:arsenate reductase
MAFKDAFRMLSRRIELFTALPLDKLDAMTTQAKLREIGQAREPAQTA